MTITFKDGESITASKKTFNELSMVYETMARLNELKDDHVITQYYRDKANYIFNELDKIGYYDGVNNIIWQKK